MASLPEATSQPSNCVSELGGKGYQLGVLSNPECAECSLIQSKEKQVSLCLFAFRPAGWDNEKKIAILHENFTTVKSEDAYEDFIVKPPVRKVPESVILRVVVVLFFFFLMYKDTSLTH